jgi:four helix bundle protein
MVEFRKGSEIAERLLGWAVEVAAIAKALPRDVLGRHVLGQLIRSATAGGANYEEARAAESRADFIHKIGIAAKEVRETIYWLRFIERGRMTSLNVDPTIQEASELAAILMASARTARKNA